MRQDTYNNSDVQRRRAQLRAEINSHKVNIDYSVFKKTDEERDLLKQAKKDHKKMLSRLN